MSFLTAFPPPPVGGREELVAICLDSDTVLRAQSSSRAVIRSGRAPLAFR